MPLGRSGASSDAVLDRTSLHVSAQASPKLPEEAQEKQPKAQPHKRGGSAAAPTQAAEPEAEDLLPMVEVLRRLRALDQPITLFGEVCMPPAAE